MAHIKHVANKIIRSRPRLHPDMSSDSWHFFLREAGKYPLLTRDQVAEVMDSGDTGKMITHNLRIAIAMAQRMCVERVPLMDTLSLSLAGLIRAVDTYDHTKSQFSAYALPWIVVTVNFGHDRIMHTLTIGRRAMWDLHAMDNGRPGSVSGRRRTSKESLDMARSATEGSARIGSDVEIGEIQIKDTTSERETELSDARLSVENIKSKYWHLLTDREADVIERSIVSGETYESIGVTYGLCRERMRQIFYVGIGKIQRAIRLDEMRRGCTA